MTARLYERYHVVAVGNPGTATNASPLRSGVIDMSKYRRIMAVLALGDVAAQNITFAIEASAVDGFDDSPSTTTEIVKAQRTASASENDDTQIVLECSAEDLGGLQYVRASLTVGAASPDTGGPASIVVLGEPYYSNEERLSSIVEVAAA